MLNTLRRQLIQLKQYHQRYIRPRTHVGMVLPMEAVRERYVVVSPDDEATAPPDEFN